MKTGMVKKKLRASMERQKERLGLWDRINAAWETGERSGVEDLLGRATNSLDVKRSKLNAKLAQDTGVNDGDDQEH